MKYGKKSALDGTYVKLLKLINDSNIKHINCFDTIFRLHKSNKVLLKIFLKIIHQGLYMICEENMGEKLFGFKRATLYRR